MKQTATRLLIAWFLLACLFAQPAVPVRAQQPEPDSAPQPLFLPMLSFAESCANQLDYMPPNSETVELDTMQRINEQRAAASLPALAHSPNITQIARFHSRDMSYQGDNPSHVGVAGETYTTRFSWLCESYSYRNEIIGWGFGGDSARMLEWWMGSPIHHDIILDGAAGTPSRGYTHFGAGYWFDPNSRWRSYWTVNFGKQVAAKSPARAEQPFTCIVSVVTSPEGGASAIICE